MNTELHPWLSTPEALATTRHAVFHASTRLPEQARIVGLDEMEAQALVILAECGQPKPQHVERTKCAHCGGSLAPKSAVPGSTSAHIGSMRDWPADQMAAYAALQVGYVLLNHLRGQSR